MTISKIASAAALVVFTGLSAWGAAGSAAQTRGAAAFQAPELVASSTGAPVGPDHRIRAFRSGGNRSAQRSSRRA